MRFPVVSVPAQNMPPRLALFKAKGLFPAPPLMEFQTTWTFRTVIPSCGFVMDRLIILLTTMSEPVVILSQPGIAVGVTVGVNVRVGVNVSVGVEVAVAVGVIVGTSVGVLLGKGVIVTTSPTNVAVGVSDATVAVAVGVSVDRMVPVIVGMLEPGVFDALGKVSRSRKPKIVRALDDVMVREPIGIRFTMGL